MPCESILMDCFRLSNIKECLHVSVFGHRAPLALGVSSSARGSVRVCGWVVRKNRGFCGVPPIGSLSMVVGEHASAQGTESGLVSDHGRPWVPFCNERGTRDVISRMERLLEGRGLPDVTSSETRLRFRFSGTSMRSHYRKPFETGDCCAFYLPKR